MPLVSLLLATSIVLAHIAAALAAYLYWKREPEKAQAAVMRRLRPLWQATKLVYHIVRWLVTLVASWTILIGLTPVYLFLAFAWVLIKKVGGERAKVTIKFT